MIPEGYPKTMVHPHYAPAILARPTPMGQPNQQGAPARWPPVTVYRPEDEQEQRSKGYLMIGEAPPARPEYAEYPMMLVHPEHVDAIPDETIAKRETNGELVVTRLPGKPEKFPPVTAKDAQERKLWEAKGYHVPVRLDPKAFDRAHAAPKPKTLPVTPDEYPKWVRGVVVKNRMEEDILLGNAVPEVPQEPLSEEDELRAKIAALEAENAALKAKPAKKKHAGQSEKMKAYWAKRRAEKQAPSEQVDEHVK